MQQQQQQQQQQQLLTVTSRLTVGPVCYGAVTKLVHRNVDQKGAEITYSWGRFAL